MLIQHDVDGTPRPRLRRKGRPSRADLVRLPIGNDDMLVISPQRWVAWCRALVCGTAAMTMDKHGVIEEMSYTPDLGGPNGLVCAAVDILGRVGAFAVHTGDSVYDSRVPFVASPRVEVVGVQGRHWLAGGHVHNHPDVAPYLKDISEAAVEVQREIHRLGLDGIVQLDRKGDVAVAVRWRKAYGAANFPSFYASNSRTLDPGFHDYLSAWNTMRLAWAIDLTKSDLVPRMDEISRSRKLVTDHTLLTCQITTPGFDTKARGVSDSLERWRLQGRQITALAHAEDSVAGIPVWEMMEREGQRRRVSITRIVVESSNTTDEVRDHADVRFGSIAAFGQCLRGLVYRLVLDGHLPPNTITELDHAVYRGSWFAHIEM